MKSLTRIGVLMVSLMALSSVASAVDATKASSTSVKSPSSSQRCTLGATLWRPMLEIER